MVEVISVSVGASAILIILSRMLLGSIQDVKTRIAIAESRINSMERTINGGFERNDRNHEQMMKAILNLPQRAEGARE